MVGLSCASGAARTTSGPPGWMNGKDARFPAEAFLTGVGTGDSKAAAEDSARAEISKIFLVHVQELAQARSSYVGYTSRAGTASWVSQNDVSQMTTTHTDQILEGMQIVECFTDVSGRVSALAVLDRRAARRRLEQQVGDLDTSIKGHIAESEKAPGKVLRLKLMMRALEKIKEREVANAQYRVVNPSGQGLPVQVDAGAFDVKMTAVLATVRVAVDVRGDDDGMIGAAITESLTRGRLQVQPSSVGADIIVRGTATGTQTNQESRTGFKFVAFDSAIQMIDVVNGTVFGSIAISHREGAQDVSDARRMCLMRLAEMIVRKFNEGLREFLLK
ncbi:MAG: LPP20 family lipoprotein [Polyangia bacterium]